MVFQGLGTNVAYAADGDGDQVDDAVDVCPAAADPFQGDVDGDGVGDLCEDATGVSSFNGTPESELIVGTAEADTLSGAGGGDAIYGLGGDDTLDGGDGRDFLSGGAGADTLTGGPGCDVFAFDPSGDNDVITDFDVEVDRMTFPAEAAATSAPAPAPTFGGEENLVVTFVADNEETGSLEFEGLPAGIEISLLSGPCFTPDVPQEEVIPPEEPAPPLVCTPLFPGEDIGQLFGIEIPLDGVQIDGTMEDETLTGTECSDAIVGDVHIDFFGSAPEDEETPTEAPCAEGVCGDDVINGLAGNDLLIGDKTFIENGETGGNDNIDGGDGDDAIIGDAAFIGGCDCGGVGDGTHASDIAGAYGGNDRLFGGDGNDVIFGDAVEVIAGFAFGGGDLIGGGKGDDILIGDALGIYGGAQAGGDSLDGGDGDDEMYGDGFEIDEFSFAGEDSLTGGAGDDLLFGDAPIIDGAAASDNFWYDASTNFGNDVIGDLGAREVTDRIVFVANGTGLTAANLDERSTVGDDIDSPDDLLATVFTDSTKTTKVGSILIVGAGGLGISSWSDLEASWPVDVIVLP